MNIKRKYQFTYSLISAKETIILLFLIRINQNKDAYITAGMLFLLIFNVFSITLFYAVFYWSETIAVWNTLFNQSISLFLWYKDIFLNHLLLFLKGLRLRQMESTLLNYDHLKSSFFTSNLSIKNYVQPSFRLLLSVIQPLGLQMIIKFNLHLV